MKKYSIKTKISIHPIFIIKHKNQINIFDSLIKFNLIFAILIRKRFFTYDMHHNSSIRFVHFSQAENIICFKVS
jgi:hypothetical protein